jgi:hypothetical protein
MFEGNFDIIVALRGIQAYNPPEADEYGKSRFRAIYRRRA